jgi:AcrR family transcriptional regulator
VARVNGEERRRRQAAETRAAIVEAAGALFEARGYTGTTIEAIADGAGVVVQTIYNSIGPKSAVLNAVLDRAAAGPESPRLVADFMRERAEATSSTAEMIEVLADWFAEAMPRTADVHRIIHQAAAVDEDIADLENRRATQRFRNYLEAAQQLAARRGSATLPADEVAAVIWSVGHPQVYRFLVETQGWDLERYRLWVSRTLAASLTRG